MYCLTKVRLKSGKLREIEEPSLELKRKQQELISLIDFKFPSYIHGVSNTSNITNSNVHITKAIVFKVDIKDFYHSLKEDRVLTAIKEYTNLISKYSEEELVNLVIYNGRLPTGAPSSPILANISFLDIDNEIISYIRTVGNISYTRYMDDLTFSCNYKDILNYSFKRNIINIITKAGFKINTKKTGTFYKSQQQKVTGIVVNQKHNIAKDERNTFRAVLDHWARKNIDLDDTIKGKLAYISSVNKDLYNRYLTYYNKRVTFYQAKEISQ